MYTVLSGGNSSISEKLRVAAAPGWGLPDIIGSTLTLGVSISGSIIVAEDMVADGSADASTEKLAGALAELLTGVALSMLSPLLDFIPALLAPAAAVAAFAAVGSGATDDGTPATGAAALAGGLVCAVAGVGVDFGTLAAGVAVL